MKYFIDTEFIEGKQDKTFLGIKYGETKHVIDLISIGIVSEKLPNQILGTIQGTTYTGNNSREYYAISKDFNLKAAWNNEWVRENVLKQIYIGWYPAKDINGKIDWTGNNLQQNKIETFTFNNFKKLLDNYGKTNKQIAQEILDFININGSFIHKPYNKEQENKVFQDIIEKYGNPEFYGYYSDYDWVVFCQLFGSMMELPKGFPYYCLDLQQYKHDKNSKINFLNNTFVIGNNVYKNISKIEDIPNYPKQTNEHNALQDAKWNYELYKFLNTL